MSRSSARAQVEPLAALAAVFAVCAGLSIYAGVVADLPLGAGHTVDGEYVTELAADRVVSMAGAGGADETDGTGASGDGGGVLTPDRLAVALSAAPDGYRLNATLRAAGHRWTVGPPAPEGTATATERVSVRVGPGRVRPGWLTVRVWR